MHVEEAVKKTVEWSKIWLSGGEVREITDRQIEEFFEVQEENGRMPQ